MRNAYAAVAILGLWAAGGCGSAAGPATDTASSSSGRSSSNASGSGVSDSGLSGSGVSGSGGSTGLDASSSEQGDATASSGQADGSVDGGVVGAPVSAGVHAVGNQLYDGTNPIRLLGVNRSGTEFECIQGDGIFDGPTDQASISAMLTWDVNAVRIPLNEDCWLAINPPTAKAATYSGSTYQQAISAFVTLLLDNGIYPILDLHWSAPGTTPATEEYPMPDMDHSVTFWQEVAAAYANQPKVIFELFNEPYPDHDMDATSAWTCWQQGGTCSNLVLANPDGGVPVDYEVAGMQTLVTAVRGAGANNLILLGGLEYSNDLTQWLAYEPTDPDDNLAAAWHVYDINECSSTTCYTSEGGPVAAKVPIVATEIGAAESDNCTGEGATFITGIMDWLDAPGQSIPAQSYLAWTWNTDVKPSLISNYNGTPVCYGSTYETHLQSVNP